jgi:hypothetical protein
MVHLKTVGYVYYCRPDLIFKKCGLADEMLGKGGVADNYPKGKYSSPCKIKDTNIIINVVHAL